MSDRYSARIEIGGELPRQHLARLCKLFEVDDEEALMARVADGDLVLEDDQAAWGEFLELETTCRDLDLPYQRRSEGYWERPPQLVFWRPGMDEPESVTTNSDGGILVQMDTLCEARDHLRAGSAARALALLEDAVITAPDLPPFRIVD
jgi:hypothetical protein